MVSTAAFTITTTAFTITTIVLGMMTVIQQNQLHEQKEEMLKLKQMMMIQHQPNAKIDSIEEKASQLIHLMFYDIRSWILLIWCILINIIC